MSISQAFLAEFNHEATGSRKMLEAVPEDKLDWKPHEKSMTLGRLAGHLAENPMWGCSIMQSTELDFASEEGSKMEPFIATSVAELLESFDKGVETCREALDQDDEAYSVVWTMRNGEQVMIEMPRVAVVRTWVFNHMYHHRGQLSVYLRLLDVPVPGVYGPTADVEGF